MPYQDIERGKATQAEVDLFVYAADLVKENVKRIYHLQELYHHMTFLVTRRAEVRVVLIYFGTATDSLYRDRCQM